jgi:hypothetical protein
MHMTESSKLRLTSITVDQTIKQSPRSEVSYLLIYKRYKNVFRQKMKAETKSLSTNKVDISR